MDAAPQPAKWDFKEAFLRFVALYLELFVIQNTSHEKVKRTIGEHTLLATSALQAYFKLQNEPLLIDIDNWLNFCFSLDGIFLEKILASDPFDESPLSLMFPRYARYLKKKINSTNKAESHAEIFQLSDNTGDIALEESETITRDDLQTIHPAPKRVPSTDEDKAYKDFHRYRRGDEASIPGFFSYMAKRTLENQRPRKVKKKEETDEGPKKSTRLKFISEAVMRGLIEQNRHGGPKRKGRANLSAIAKIIADRYDTSCSHETVKLHIESLVLLEFAKLVPSEH